MRFLKSYPDFSNSLWREARARLARSNTRIAQIDSGLFAHPALGFQGHIPPRNLLFGLGRNFYDPGPPYGNAPQTDLRIGADWVSRQTEYPDHGVKTLSVLIGTTAKFTGVAPGAKVVPYRVSNGPLFRQTQREQQLGADPTARIGMAIEHALTLNPRPRVITISMGNPDLTPFFLILYGLNGWTGISRRTTNAIDRCYQLGIPVVCAAGQVVRAVVLPALMQRTIAVGGYGLRDDLTTKVHYPRGGYTNPPFVDTWALAENINRAAGTRMPDGRIKATHAENEVNNEPSGTSYAAPFVAGAYALWFEAFRDTLTSAAFSGDNAWRRVEAFRQILRQRMPVERIASGHGNPSHVDTRPLDLPHLLTCAPEPHGLQPEPAYPG